MNEQQMQARQQPGNPRRVTKTPAPLRTPVGGASPPKNIAQLAKSDDITEFVNAERARKKAAGRG